MKTARGVMRLMDKKVEPPQPLLRAPNGEPFPLGYRWLREHGLVGLRPWMFLDDADEAWRLRGEFVREVASPNRCPIRDLLPFAQRKDRDELAGFVVEGGKLTQEVALVHLSFKGRPERDRELLLKRFSDIWEFAKEALLEDARDWANEEALLRIQRQK